MDAIITNLPFALNSANITAMIYALNFIISIWIIFFDKKDASATLAWIMVLYILPVIGLMLYIIFSQNIARSKMFKLTELEEKETDFILAYQINEMNEYDFYYPNEVTQKWNHFIRLNQTYGESYLTTNNDIQLITDGKMKYHKLMNDIRHAQYRINIMYFIIKNDAVGMKLIDLLTEKAKQGVEVRLLMDAMGSKSISRWRLREFKRAGGKFAFFYEPLIRHMFIKFNYRNHRKMAIIDDEIGYIGGFNIANEYLGYKKKFGYWRDTHLRIQGDSIIALNERFFLDWRYASKEKIDLLHETVPKDYRNNRNDGTIPVQIVSSGPDSKKEKIKQGLMRMITYARKNIYLQTPYLVPDRSVIDSLIMAAQSGVDVRIMIPCMPDHPFVYRTTLSNAGELIEAGAKVYIYENGFLHAKTLVVDSEVSTVGSANFDIRSFKLNFEANAFIFDKAFAEKMETQFEKDMLKSKEYTAYDRAHISIMEHFKESISRLLTDIL